MLIIQSTYFNKRSCVMKSFLLPLSKSILFCYLVIFCFNSKCLAYYEEVTGITPNYPPPKINVSFKDKSIYLDPKSILANKRNNDDVSKYTKDKFIYDDNDYRKFIRQYVSNKYYINEYTIELYGDCYIFNDSDSVDYDTTNAFMRVLDNGGNIIFDEYFASCFMEPYSDTIITDGQDQYLIIRCPTRDRTDSDFLKVLAFKAGKFQLYDYPFDIDIDYKPFSDEIILSICPWDPPLIAIHNIPTPIIKRSEIGGFCDYVFTDNSVVLARNFFTPWWDKRVYSQWIKTKIITKIENGQWIVTSNRIISGTSLNY